MYSVEVIVDSFGTYKKGAKLKMEGTTARACEENGKVKILKGKGKDVTTKTKDLKKSESDD